MGALGGWVMSPRQLVDFAQVFSYYLLVRANLEIYIWQ